MEEGEYPDPQPQRLVIPRTTLHLSNTVTSMKDGFDSDDVHETWVMSEEENSQVNS